MANIKLKRGSGVPSGLTYGEPAFDITNSRLYVGITGGSALVGVAGGGVHSFNGLTGAVTGVTTGTSNIFVPVQHFNAGLTSSGNISLRKETNTATQLSLYAGATGSVSYSEVSVGAAPGYGIGLKSLAEGYTTNSTYPSEIANSNVLYANGSQGLRIHSYNANMQFWTGNTGTLKATLTTGGDFILSNGGISATGGTFTNDIVVNGVRVGEGGGSISTNVAVGQSALNANTTGNNNTAIGYQSLLTGTTGANNTAVGSGSLTLNIANNNTAVGQAALSVNTTGNANVAIGYRALRDNTTGTQNTAIGQGALQFQLTGYDNTALGRASLLNLQGGSGNVALGTSSGRFVGDGVFPTGISLTNANYSIFIGAHARAAGESQSNQIVIGGLDALGDGSDTTVIGNTATISTRVFGTFITNGGVCAAGGVTFAGSLSGSTATFTGLITSTAGFSGTGITLSGNLSASTKSFVIPHPTKPSKNLQYSCLEGPENGVYVRGRLTGTNVIELPDYWTALVHEDSITVQLTAFGEHKNYFVKSIQGNKVTIGPRSKDTDCFYLVQGERKDVPRLTVEC